MPTPPCISRSALTPQGWRENVRVMIAGARICEVESGVAPSAQDERHALGLPAIANLHSPRVPARDGGAR